MLCHACCKAFYPSECNAAQKGPFASKGWQLVAEVFTLLDAGKSRYGAQVCDFAAVRNTRGTCMNPSIPVPSSRILQHAREIV